MIFDTHTHLNVPQFAEDLDETIARAHEYGVNEMAVVGFDQPTIEKSLQLSEKYPEIYSIIGWHPTEARSYTPAVEKQLYQWFDSSDKIVALGEIGLDYYWMNDSKEVQTKVFRRQIAMAKELGLPFSVHTRDALADTYQVLKEEKVGAQGGIMHSFSGDWEWAQRFLDLGMMISLSGVVTFKKALEVKEVAKNVPLDALLVETDAPYLAPVPYRGKRNEPGYTSYVVDEIASLRGDTRDNIARQTRANAYRLFQLGEEYDASK